MATRRSKATQGPLLSPPTCALGSHETSASASNRRIHGDFLFWSKVHITLVAGIRGEPEPFTSTFFGDTAINMLYQ
jgi:hypothetical protein